MATPNYSYEKRQRELAKKRKAEEKRQRKLNQRPDDAPGPAQPGAAGNRRTRGAGTRHRSEDLSSPPAARAAQVWHNTRLAPPRAALFVHPL